MCLTVLPGCKIEIAQEDITCWKNVCMFGHDEWMAPVRGTFHNYDEVLTACDRLSMKSFRDTYGVLYYIIEEGFHAYVNSNAAECRNIFRIRTLVKCTIPAGAEYCLGTNTEMVANKMIVHKPKTE